MGRYYVFAMYDTQRIVLIQFNDQEMFEMEDEKSMSGSVRSGATGSTINSKYLTDSQLSGNKKKKAKPKSLKTKVIYYDDLFAIEKGEDTREKKAATVQSESKSSPSKPKTLRD